jgi:chromosomal replication initiation ATPase DnaA
MTQQLVFDLPIRPAMGREDFMVSQANAAALAQIDKMASWPFQKLVLCGPEASGKTHLAHVWAAQTGAGIVAAADMTEDMVLGLAQSHPALVIEDADRIAGRTGPETWLFHLHNALANRQVPLLITARDAPSRWGMVLADLNSRMAQAGLARLDAPDDALLSALMLKMAHDRQMKLPIGVVNYALPRIARSCAAVKDFIARLDAQSLSAKEPPMQKHARAILDADRDHHEFVIRKDT